MKQGCAFVVALLGAAGMSGSVLAQSDVVSHDQVIGDFEEPTHRELSYSLDSGVVKIETPQPGARDVQVPVWEGVVEIEDAGWIRLRFGDVALAKSTENVRESYLRITSLEDGYEQYLDLKSLDQWSNTSAYFNGRGVKIEIMASPNATAQFNRVSVTGVQVSPPETGPRSICGPTDDRVPSTDNRDARLMPIGCSAWMFSDHGSRAMTAAHCSPSGGNVIQFNVPLSSSTGGYRSPPPQDQYVVDGSSVQQSIGGIFIGNDWAYFGVFDNSNTGLDPVTAYGVHHTLATSGIPNDGRPIRITGYGTTGAGVPASWNGAQKTHVGPLVSVAGNRVRYATDTTGGNSGSSILDDNNQLVIGVHTNAGCGSGGGSNNGTSIFNSDLQNALANPQGVTQPRTIQASIVLEPTHVQPEGGDEVVLRIDNLRGHTVVGAPKFIVNATDGTSFEQDMVDNGDNTYTGTFGSYYCGSGVSYHFEVEDEEGTVVRVPENGTFETIALDELTVIAFDDFQANPFWDRSSLGGTGEFIHATPNGYGLGDPDTDADGSGACYVTSNINGTDVDNGTVVLESPPIDVTGVGEATLSIAVWMEGSAEDSLTVEFSENIGITYTEVYSTSSTGGMWHTVNIPFDSNTSQTPFFKLRIKCTDAGADSQVEGGVDSFRIANEVCDTGCAADLNGDDEVNFFDVSAFLTAYNSADLVADFNGDGILNFFDVSAFLTAFGEGCP